MTTDFTQDTVLHFLQSSGGSVKNSDLLAHFRNFIRDHADRERNRENFKKFVNSVATVQQVDGVSYVVLRKKFRGHVPGGGERVTAGKIPESSGRQSPAGRAEKPRQKPPLSAVTTPAAPGGTTGKKVLPAAGIILNNNNNNVETNLNLPQKQLTSPPELSVRPTIAPAVDQTPSLPDRPAQDRLTEAGQHRLNLGPGPGPTPVVAVRLHHGGTSQQAPVPEPLRERQPGLQSGAGLHQEPPLHQQVAPRRFRYRPSYKSAVSCDDEEEEEEEEVPLRRGSAGGAWLMSAPLGDVGRAISASSPCIIDPPAPPSVVSSSSSSSSSERMPPKIYIQNVKGEMLPAGGPDWRLESGVGHRGQWARPGPGPGYVPGEPTRRSLPLEVERSIPSPDRAQGVAPRTDHGYLQPMGAKLDPRQDPDDSQRVRLSSSQSSIFSPSSDTGLSSSDWPPSPRGSGFSSSYEDLLARRAGKAGGEIQEVLQRAQRNRIESETRSTDSKTMAPLYHSSEHLREDQELTGRLLPRHLSTGDLYDEDAESSDSSTFTPPLRQRPGVARRLSSQLRSRMCRSLGADLDQLLQEEAREGGGGGNEAARLSRLQLISSSLSLHCNMSSSSLSSCSTPPRCDSLGDMDEGMEGRAAGGGGGGGGGGSLPPAPSSVAQQEGSSRQSLVPLEPREHAWLVKGAAGAWPDIYSLFREDSSLLNRRDFISGFTVLHWIAKHGDHRVLNTLWYGVQKAGLTFDVDARATCGHTPLHIAAIHGHKNIMKLLVSKFNADLRLRDTAGKRAWQYLGNAESPEVFQLLGAPARAAGKREGGVGRDDSSAKLEQHRHRRRRHHFSSASSGERPLTISGTAKVKRSTSIAAFLKHKSMRRFHGHQSDSSI